MNTEYRLITNEEVPWISMPGNAGSVGDMQDITDELNRLLRRLREKEAELSLLESQITTVANGSKLYEDAHNNLLIIEASINRLKYGSDMPMDAWDNLLVRHCKSRRTSIRSLKRIIGWKCALLPEHVEESWVLECLLKIVEKYRLKPLIDLIAEMHPSNRWRYGCDTEGCDETTGAAVAAVVSVLRLTEVKKLPGYRMSARWRNREKREEV